MAILIAIPLSASAADEDAGANLGEIAVEGVRQNESAEMPGAFTTVIKPREFDKRVKSTADVLSETAGVDVTSLGGEGQLSTVSIRGSSAEQVAVFVDGVRMNTALTSAFDFSTIPLESIDRIEVIRGAASARFGTDAIGGIINIVTKRVGAKRAIEAKLTGASFSTLNTSESWSQPFSNWDMVLSHNHQSSAGDFSFKSAGVTLAGGVISDPRTYTRINNGSISEDLLTKFSVSMSEDARVSLINDFSWIKRQVPGMEIETTLLYPANPLEANEEIFRDTASVQFTIDNLFTRSLTFEAGANNSFSRDHFTDPSPALGDPIDDLTTTFSPEAYVQLMHSAELGFMSIQSTGRGQYNFDHSSDSSPYSWAKLMGSHTRNTGAFFIEEELGFFSDKLRIIPSGRVEDANARKTRASWRVGVVGTPFEWIDIKSNVGTAFRYPSFDELYFPDQGYIRGNPNLNDELSFGWDAGIVARPPKTSIEISYYDNRIDNQILFVPISAFTIQPINTGRVNSHGIEVSVISDPLKWLHLNANYTWLNAKFVGNGLRLPGRPEHKANARAELSAKWASVFGEVQYVGSFPANAANTVTITRHTAVNAGTTISFAKHFFGTFEVKDLTNVQIYDARGFPLPRRSYWVTFGAKT